MCEDSIEGLGRQDQKLIITERAGKNLLENDILLNLGIEVFQKQPPPHGPDLRKTPNISHIGTDVNRKKFASDRQPDQGLTHYYKVSLNYTYQADFPTLKKEPVDQRILSLTPILTNL